MGAIWDFIGWDALPCGDQLYGVAVGAFTLGGWFVLAVEALFSSRGQRRNKPTKGKARKRGRR